MKEIMDLIKVQLETTKLLQANINQLAELAKMTSRNIELLQEEIECHKHPDKFPAKAVASFWSLMFKKVVPPNK